MPLWNEKLLQNPNFQFIFHRLIPYLTLTEIAPIFAKLPFPMLKNFVVFDVGANHGIWSAAFLHAAAHKTKEIHLFEPLDGDGLVAALDRLLRDPALGRALAERAFARLRRRHTWRRNAERILAAAGRATAAAAPTEGLRRAG